MATKDHAVEYQLSSTHAELADVPLLDDAARRFGGSGQALYEYFSRLDALRAATQDLGHAVLAERAARAEVHTRVCLSAGLDALNELHDLGLLQESVRNAIAHSQTLNDVTIADALTRAKVVLDLRYPEFAWNWVEGTGQLLTGLVKTRFESDGRVLRATVTQKEHPIFISLTPDKGFRVNTSRFFSADGIYATNFAGPAITTEGTSARSAYDAALDGLAFARESVYRHARNAAELGAPARTGAGPAVIAIVLVVIGALLVTVSVIEFYLCKKEHDSAACKWADILSSIGTALLGAGAGDGANNSGSNTGTSTLQLGTNPQ